MISWFLNTQNLFEKEQHGFKVDKSVVTSSVGLFKTIIDAVGKSQNSIRVFMNLSKGFFSVTHSKLIEIRHSLGVPRLAPKKIWFIF